MSKPEKKEHHEHKPEHKPDHGHPKPEAPKGKQAQVVPGGCLFGGCKTHVTRFGFCDEHYDQFKFGLIKKTGQLVSDWEKKYEHYMAYKAKRSAHKVA